MSKTVKAGAQLKYLRNMKEMTQQTAAERSGGKLTVPAISRLENGTLGRPSMYELCAYAEVLGMTPNEVAEIFGYWREDGEPSQEPAEIAEARRLATKMADGPLRDDLLSWIRFAVAHTSARVIRAAD